MVSFSFGWTNNLELINKISAILQLSASVPGGRFSISPPSASPARCLQCFQNRQKMKINKYLKGCLIIFGIILLVFAFFAAWFWWSMETNHTRAEEDGIKYSKECDSIKVITEKPSIMLGKFDKSEIDVLKFYTVRNNKVVKDTLVNFKITSVDHYLSTEIPFNEFLKTDTIIVETKENCKRFYNISGFHHYAYLHYGMFGYVGSHDCRLDKNYIVNGKESNGTLLKADGMKENNLVKK